MTIAQFAICIVNLDSRKVLMVVTFVSVLKTSVQVDLSAECDVSLVLRKMKMAVTSVNA